MNYTGSKMPWKKDGGRVEYSRSFYSQLWPGKEQDDIWKWCCGPSFLNPTPQPRAWLRILIEYQIVILFFALCLPAGLEGKQPGRQLHCWCGVFRGKWWGPPSCDGVPWCLPAGPIILQTATIKNDLQALANFSMLLASLESYLALRKNTDGQTGLLSKCMEFDDCCSESWNLQRCQCRCFLPYSP